jgi:alpha-tubulin suppressor-like RCC1 family protein
VAGNHQFRTISAGGTHSCGVDLAGDAWCWGDNTYGQLGNMSHGGTSSSPVRVAGGNSWASISTGQWHSCGITTTGNLLCWGHGVWGQLGVTYSLLPPECDTSHFRCATSPRQVQPGTKFSMVSAGYAHSCATTTAGAAYCWGSNGAGQLGDGNFSGVPTSTSRDTPVLVYGGHTFANISAGMGYSCGVTTAGKGYCWGSNWHGKLGDGGPVGYGYSREPIAVATSYTFASISAGYHHTCGVTPWSYSGNVLLCWGINSDGQLGDGTINTTSTPVVSRGY